MREFQNSLDDLFQGIYSDVRDMKESIAILRELTDKMFRGDRE